MKFRNASPYSFFRTFVVLLLSVPAMAFVVFQVYDVDWEKVQQLKRQYLSLTAQHAMEMQKVLAANEILIPLPEKMSALGEIALERNGNILGVEVDAAPRTYGREPSEVISIALMNAVDAFANTTGIALTVETADGTSPEVRMGLRLTGTNGEQTQILPILPVLSAWGEKKHELYFDWSMLNFAKEEDILPVLRSVEKLEITFASQQRAPKRGASQQAQPAKMTLSDLRFVDYHLGSFDPSRRSLMFDQDSEKWVASDHFDLTLQHRYQEVSGIVASYGGKKGEEAAIQSLDYAVRTQCWDGSFIETRRGANTIASGEYTFGFTLYGLLQAYKHLDSIGHVALKESVTVGPERMTRRDFYQRMFYRGAMARTAALPSAYRDDIIGTNTLVGGANRVLGYAIAMRMIADVLTDPRKKEQVLENFGPIMREIADAQGEFSGGFPVLGEGDRYKGKGIHYDAGYTRTHMDWLIVGVRQTGDPLLVQILRKYQAVFDAAMDKEGTGILPMISERHQGRSSVRIILPDATYQVGVQYGLPVIAQWGYNVSKNVWSDLENPRNNFFASSSTVRGYTLGAHRSILLDDRDPKPVPNDPGYLFPRQFPLWSTFNYSKDGVLQRTSAMTFHPDGTQTSDYRMEVGEYPVTIGVPVAIKSSDVVKATAHTLTGWPKLLPDGASLKVSGDVKARAKVGKPFKVKLKKETRFVITGPDTVLPVEFGGEKVPFSCEFTLAPEKPGQTVEVTILQGTGPYQLLSN